MASGLFVVAARRIIRDNRCISAVLVLSPAEHVKVPEHYGLNPVRLCKDICVEFKEKFSFPLNGIVYSLTKGLLMGDPLHNQLAIAPYLPINA